MKWIFIVIGVFIFGFLWPIAYQAIHPLDPIVQENFRRANEETSFLYLAARVIDNYGEYPDNCRGRAMAQELLQTYSWMMIHGPIVEMCVTTDENGRINGVKSVGAVSY
jgi:hypothetical protein